MISILEGFNCVVMSKETFNCIETAYSMYKAGKIKEGEKHIIKGRGKAEITVEFVNDDLFFKV